MFFTSLFARLAEGGGHASLGGQSRTGAAPSARVTRCLVGEHHGLYPVAHPELVEDVAHMGLDGALTDEERAGDLRVRQALREVDEDLAFASGQGSSRGSRRRLGPGGELLDHRSA